MFGSVDIRRTKIGTEQLIATKDIEWLAAVPVVVTVEAPFLLSAMNQIVGGMEVESQFLRSA